MEIETTIYIIALYLKHTDFIRAKERQTFHWKMCNTQFYIITNHTHEFVELMDAMTNQRRSPFLFTVRAHWLNSPAQKQQNFRCAYECK